MLNGFEKQTEPLTDYESNVLLPLVIRGLKIRFGEKNAITNRKMTVVLRNQDYEISEARVRKIINHIRNHALIERLIATSKGYYIATSIEEMGNYIDSLRGRESAIGAMRESMEKQYNEWLWEKTKQK